MAKIRINLKTKEIEIEGPEPFVDDYLDTIKEIIAASFSKDKRQEEIPSPRNKRPELPKKAVEPKITTKPAAKEVRRRRKRRTGTPSPGTISTIAPEKPFVRKHILRKAGTEHTKEPRPGMRQGDSGRVSIEAMKANLGLTEQQVMTILRDAERQGRVQRDADGSYVWVS